jgi:ribosomal protein L7/L12
MRQRGIDGTLTDDERDAIDRRDLMAAVRSIRDRTGLGLRDAKEYMDRARVR